MAFHEFDGCALLTCGAVHCHAIFCGVCLATDFVVPPGDTLARVAHMHVAECEYLHGVRGVPDFEGVAGAFTREDDYTKANARFRAFRVAQFFNGIEDTGVRDKVRDSVKGLLAELECSTGVVVLDDDDDEAGGQGAQGEQAGEREQGAQGEQAGEREQGAQGEQAGERAGEREQGVQGAQAGEWEMH
jgi:hypothetical protein